MVVIESDKRVNLCSMPRKNLGKHVMNVVSLAKYEQKEM